MNANLLAVNFDGSVNLLQTALVVCVFWALLRGKNAIPNKSLFHLGWILLTLSTILPIFAVFIVQQLLIELPGEYWSYIHLATGPGLTILSFPILVLALTPPNKHLP